VSVQVRAVLTATNADVLNGTDLENLPGAGFMAVLAASTVADTTMTITGRGFEVPVRNIPLPLRANGQPSEADDTPVAFFVPAGGKVLVGITEVTAATIVVQAMWMGMEEAASL